MASNNTNYALNDFRDRYPKISSTNCMSFTNSRTNPYYILPNLSLPIDEFSLIYINDINETFGGVKYLKSKEFKNSKGENTITLYNVIEITPIIKSGYYRLFINQLVRYVVLEEAQATINTYCKLKEKYPKEDFWFLFHMANLISFTTKYDGYYQPFLNTRSEVEYNLNLLIDKLKTVKGVNNSTTLNIEFSPNVKENLRKFYNEENWEEFYLIMKCFRREYKNYECINTHKVSHLTKGKMYNGLKSIDNTHIKVIDDNYINRMYISSRFKEVI